MEKSASPPSPEISWGEWGAPNHLSISGPRLLPLPRPLKERLPIRENIYKEKPMKGKVWRFGEAISTDHIIPGRYFYLRSNLPELSKHLLEYERPGFSEMVSPGDFIVAGQNFGLGSSREHAAIVIKMNGIQAVLAKSFARIFYRNCFNNGLPAIICDAGKFSEGDIIELFIEEGKIVNHTKNETLLFAALPPVMKRILSDGGLVEHVKKYKDLKLF
jgi:3-isopropylmalate/(R)-2-methylmalate dehydratase small subunit